jgi:hypothetical protein
MRIYISDKYKHIIMAPCKAGSCTIDGLFKAQWNWDSIYIGKKIENPKSLLHNYFSPGLLTSFKVILFVRNPVDWIISGYRYMQIEANLTSKYPRSLIDHLIAVKNKSINDELWLEHCYRQPAFFYHKWFKIQKLEEFNSFLTYMDENCNSDYRKHKNYNINKNTEVPYPYIGKKEAKLLMSLTLKTAKIGNYDVVEAIENHNRKHYGKNHELAEYDF